MKLLLHNTHKIKDSRRIIEIDYNHFGTTKTRYENYYKFYKKYSNHKIICMDLLKRCIKNSFQDYQ